MIEIDLALPAWVVATSDSVTARPSSVREVAVISDGGFVAMPPWDLFGMSDYVLVAMGSRQRSLSGARGEVLVQVVFEGQRRLPYQGEFTVGLIGKRADGGIGPALQTFHTASVEGMSMGRRRLDDRVEVVVDIVARWGSVVTS